MNRHNLTYIDLHPEPVNRAEPPDWLVILFAAVAVLCITVLCAAAFSL